MYAFRLAQGPQVCFQLLIFQTGRVMGMHMVGLTVCVSGDTTLTHMFLLSALLLAEPAVVIPGKSATSSWKGQEQRESFEEAVTLNQTKIHNFTPPVKNLGKYYLS